jgi:hypothetical protein
MFPAFQDHSDKAAMSSSRLSIITLTFRFAASSMAAATDTPSFLDMTC